MDNETAKHIAAITDEALFERLATAVMREADPRYATLSHPGVNADGKTVKAPLDGIAFIPGASPPHMLAAHHTTTKASGLENKWLLDPRTVKPRRNTPTGQPGDIIKTAAIVADERKREPAMRATLALSTSMEPSVDLVRDAHALARMHGIELDPWPRSRLAHFLDSPRGQWLRHQYLGIPQEKISRELLAHLSRKSLQQFQPLGDDPGTWVGRAVDASLAGTDGQMTFVMAEAGLGKTVACHKLLCRHVARGGFGLIVPHQLIDQSLTASQAIDLSLRQLHPQLAPDAGADALLLCEAAMPFFVVIEDINRSGKAVELLEKIAAWGQIKPGKSDPLLWRVFCPVWPQVLLGLKEQVQKSIAPFILTCPLMTPPEGRTAVQERAKREGRALSGMDADAIAQALGYDPLLIGLHDLQEKPDPQKVIARFIDSALARSATADATFNSADYRTALRALAMQMLLRRDLDPRWAEIASWFASSSDTLPTLRALAKHGEVIRVIGSGNDQRLAFRHDRVRDSLLTDALSERLAQGALERDLLSDPFFAEMFGSILASDDAPASLIADLTRANPLALFHALSHATGSPGRASTIAGTIIEWLASPESGSPSNQHLRWHAQRVLSQIESPHVLPILALFTPLSWDGWAARFRNGDLAGGLELSMRLEPGMGDPWRDSLMDHVKLRFGDNLIKAVGDILRKTDLPEATRLAAIRIAGYLADAKLGDGLVASWQIDHSRAAHLEDYLISAAYCCEGNPERLLAPICDAWAALPDQPEKENSPSERDDLAADGARFAFRRRPPVAAIAYFIKRAEGKELEWPITYMLHEIDEQVCIEFVSHRLAAIARRLEGTSNFSPFLSHALDRWSRYETYGEKPMSMASKRRLTEIWTAEASDKHLKEQAFNLWAASQAEGDLDILKRIDPSNLLWSKALFARLVRGDHSAIPALEEKLLHDREDYWWQTCRYIWSDRLTQALDHSLTRRGERVEHSWPQKHDPIDWIVSELILHLPIEAAEAVLLKHWDHLGYTPYFIHAALHTAKLSLAARVQAAVSECPEPKGLFKHIHFHYGMEQKGRSAMRVAQIESLIPYFDLFDQHTIRRFWEFCNEQGWLDIRRKYLDPRIDRTLYGILSGEEEVFQSLDAFLARDRIYNFDFWFERRSQEGMAADEIFEYLGKWLSARKTLKALELVATAIARPGQRKHIAALVIDEIEPKDAAAAVVADAAFAVRVRTLR